MYKVLLFYKYVNIEDPKALMDRERSVLSVLNMKGRLLIAEEGINGIVEGTTEACDKYIAHLREDGRFKKMNVKESEGTGSAFPKLMVKVKDEIVSTKFAKEINPNKETGKRLQPHELKRWYEDGKDFVVVDMRNDYELKSGYFDKTVNPGLKSSRDLANKDVIDKLRVHNDKTIVTVCTGGVRCEKMSAYLLNQGFKDVYQLHNGMHAYMEAFPGDKNYKGTLYTFDNRRVMNFGGDREIVGKCDDCSVACEDYYDYLKDDGHEEQVILCQVCAAAKGDRVRK